MSGMYMRKMSTSGFLISLKPSRPGKKVPQNTAVLDQQRKEMYGTGLKRTMPSVFTIRDGMEAQLDLCIHNVLHGGIFNARQLLLLSLAIVQVCACFEEVIRA